MLSNLAYSTAKTAVVFGLSNCILWIFNWMFSFPDYPLMRFILWTCPTYALCFEINQNNYEQIASRSFEIFVGMGMVYLMILPIGVQRYNFVMCFAMTNMLLVFV